MRMAMAGKLPTNGGTSSGGGGEQLGIGRRQDPSLDDSQDKLVNLRKGVGLLDISGSMPGPWTTGARGNSRATKSTPTCAKNVDMRDDTQQIFRKREQVSSKGLEHVTFLSSSRQMKTNYSDMYVYASPSSCPSTIASTPPSTCQHPPMDEVQMLYDDHRIVSPESILPPNKAIDGTRSDRIDNFSFREACIAAIKSPAHPPPPKPRVTDETFPILSTRNRSTCNIGTSRGDANNKSKPILTSSNKNKGGQRVRFSPSLLSSKVETPTTTSSSSRKPVPDSSAARKLLRKYRAETRTSSIPSQLRSLSSSGKIVEVGMITSNTKEKAKSSVKIPSATAGSSSPPPPCGRHSTIARSVYAASRLEQKKYLQFDLAKNEPTIRQVPPTEDTVASPLPSRRIDLTSQQNC